MPREKLSPHLINYQGAKRCSICMMLFPSDAQPSRDRSFAEHVIANHRPGQKPEDVNRAAARIDTESNDR
jgi:hypothetical protein